MSTSAIDYDAIKRAALAACPDLLFRWFPNGKLVGNEFKVGNLAGDPGDSLSINIRTGQWADFAADHRGGDLISLYAAKEGLGQAAAALAVAREVGQEHMAKPRKAKTARGNKGAAKLRPIMPVPDNVPDPDFRHPRLGMPSQTWTYPDAEGRRLGHTCRFDRPGGGKEILPLTLCQAEDGRLMWKWQGFPTPRPLYGLDELARKPNANVVLVEGEKTAEAARKLFPNCAVVTWPGGCKAIKHADWSPLKGRKVVIIPDADEPGRAAAEELAQMLAGIADGIRIVDPPKNLPKGWDMADAFEEGWSPNWAAKFVHEHMRKPATAAAPPKPAPEPPPHHEPPPEGDGPVPTVVDEQPHFRVTVGKGAVEAFIESWNRWMT